MIRVAVVTQSMTPLLLLLRKMWVRRFPSSMEMDPLSRVNNTPTTWSLRASPYVVDNLSQSAWRSLTVM